jgi:hypothetical protein
MPAEDSVSLGEIAASFHGRVGVVSVLRASGDLYANPVRFEAVGGVEEHVNDEVDVILLGTAGSGIVKVDGEHPVSNGTMTFVPNGARCPTRSTSGDFDYLTVPAAGASKSPASCELSAASGEARRAHQRKHGGHMKRHPDLRIFSDDHHQGIVSARRLRRAAGDEGDLTDTARAFLEFWREDTSLHFRKEEEVLLPVLARYGGHLAQGSVVEMLAQHARIRGLAMQLGDEIEGERVREDTLRELGEQLEAHIRLEEREVFPFIEEALPEDALHEVTSRLAAFEPGPPHEPWVPAEGLSFAPWPGPGDSEGGGSD